MLIENDPDVQSALRSEFRLCSRFEELLRRTASKPEEQARLIDAPREIRKAFEKDLRR